MRRVVARIVFIQCSRLNSVASILGISAALGTSNPNTGVERIHPPAIAALDLLQEQFSSAGGTTDTLQGWKIDFRVVSASGIARKTAEVVAGTGEAAFGDKNVTAPLEKMLLHRPGGFLFVIGTGPF